MLVYQQLVVQMHRYLFCRPNPITMLDSGNVGRQFSLSVLGPGSDACQYSLILSNQYKAAFGLKKGDLLGICTDPGGNRLLIRCDSTSHHCPALRLRIGLQNPPVPAEGEREPTLLAQAGMPLGPQSSMSFQTLPAAASQERVSFRCSLWTTQWDGRGSLFDIGQICSSQVRLVCLGAGVLGHM